MSEKLETNKLNINSLFGKGRFYNIPEYQRPYVWSDENINQLLEDLHNSFSQKQEHGMREYFLGCFVLNKKKSVNDEYLYYDILDGQQRFITLMLLQIVFRDLLDDVEAKRRFAGNVYQKQDKMNNIPERERLQFGIREDADFISKSLLHVEKLDFEQLKFITKKHEHISCRNMANTCVVIHKWFMELQDNFASLDVQDYLVDFSRYILNDVVVLDLVTNNNLDDAFNLFTTLNSTGVKLTEADILRAQNLRMVADKYARERYAKEWDSYESFKPELLPSYSFNGLLSDLMFIKLQARDGKVVSSMRSAYDWMSKREPTHKAYLPKGEPVFHYIADYFKHLQDITNLHLQVPDVKKHLFKHIFSLMNAFGKVSQTYIMVLLHFKATFGDEYILEFLLKLENLCSMNWLLGGKKAMTREFILLRTIDRIKREGGNGSDMVECDELRYEHNAKGANTAYNIDSFVEHLRTEDFGVGYSGTKANKRIYLLLKLDFLMNKDNEFVFNKDKSSVEHLMPQKLTSNNKYSVMFHEDYVHKLGNLLLLRQKKNSALSNRDYAEKKDAYKQKGIENRTNADYVFKNYKTWNPEDIKHNHKRVIMMLEKYYKGNSLHTLNSMENLVN